MMNTTLFDNIQLYLQYKQLQTEKRIQIYCLSDLHIDYKDNFDWINQLKCYFNENIFSILICSGDVSHEIKLLSEIFHILKTKFNEVCYIPGNHDLWTRGSLNSVTSSFDKLIEILRCANECQVITSPIRVISNLDHCSVTICPLYSWYHTSFDTEPSLTHPLYIKYENILKSENAIFDYCWADFRQCKWPKTILQSPNDSSQNNNYCENNIKQSILEDNMILSELFSQLNEPFLNSLSTDNTSLTLEDVNIDVFDYVHDIISFSHFLPREELLPEKRFLLEPNLSKVTGSKILEKQIRKLGSKLHIFGHTHIPISLNLDEIQYTQWPLGNARETENLTSLIIRNGPLLVYDSNNIHSNSTSNSNLDPEYNIKSNTECNIDSTIEINIETNIEINTSHKNHLTGILKDTICLTSNWSEYYQTNTRDLQKSNELSPWLLKKIQGFLSYY